MIDLRDGVTSFALGMHDSRAPDEYSSAESRTLINCRPSLLGNRMQRRKAWTLTAPNVLDRHVWIGGYIADDGVKELVALSESNVIRNSIDEGATWAGIGISFTEGDEPPAVILFNDASA